jgi:hypothetical protein
MKTTLNQRIKAVQDCITATEKHMKACEHKGAATLATFQQTIAALKDVLQDLKDTKYLGAPARNISVQPLIFDQP